ncbi:hypothetical protein OG589_01705 [Sphaerisporangium sp. NBC_01403]|uniref:hypothetical protein n=1 Tax=Sphaerisporangium sp. NBC_01403 TaxID=2903599 RepID=UPI003251A1F8
MRMILLDGDEIAWLSQLIGAFPPAEPLCFRIAAGTEIFNADVWAADGHDVIATLIRRYVTEVL